MATLLQDLVSGTCHATLWCCRRAGAPPGEQISPASGRGCREEGLAPMLCHSNSSSLPLCHLCAPDSGLMGLVLSPVPPKTALTLGVQQVSWCEGHTHACVLQLCRRVCPHHLLPGMPVLCCLVQTCACGFLRGAPPPGATYFLFCLSSNCLSAGFCHLPPWPCVPARGWAVLGSLPPSLLPFPADVHGADHHLPEHRSALQHGLSPGDH